MSVLPRTVLLLPGLQKQQLLVHPDSISCWFRPLLTCTFLRLASSALLSALISTRGALIYRNVVVEIRSEPNGLLIPIEMLLRTILIMRVSSRNLSSTQKSRNQNEHPGLKHAEDSDLLAYNRRHNPFALRFRQSVKPFLRGGNVRLAFEQLASLDLLGGHMVKCGSRSFIS